MRHLFSIIFCSFWLGSFSQIDHWEAIVYEGDSWDYLVPTGPVSGNWKEIGFNPVGWNTGAGGFGYGDGDDQTILPAGTISCYQRISFNILDTSAIEAAALTIDYDDGFVAYLNGVEISRDLLQSPVPSWDELTTGLHEADIYQSNYPAQYSLSSYFLDTVLVPGANVLSIQTHNQSSTSSDMSSRAWFHLAMNTSGITYNQATNWFQEPVILTSSNLPIVVINTDQGLSIPDEPKLDAIMGIIYNGPGNTNYTSDPFNEYYGQIGIEKRGSSSQTFPKKPYGFETRGPDSSNHNVSIFSWPADNDWTLIAPYSDKSLIRNVLTYKLGNELGRYSPRTKLVELILNGNYQGVYVLTEKIKINPGRVNINEVSYSDTVDQELSGGYIFKKDKTTGGGIIAWTSPFPSASPATGPVHFQLQDPKIDTIHPLQVSYLQNRVTAFETALDGPNFMDPVNGYSPYIDVGSFIDFMIVNEISKNVDGYRISTFFYKEHLNQGNKIHAGPLWDFNLAWGNANYCQGGITNGWEIYFNDVCGGGGTLDNPFYWNKLVTDPEFSHALNCRWQELRMGPLHEDSLLNYIDSVANYLSDAADRNFTQWPILGTYVWPNNFVGNTYQEEVDYLKTWISDRLNWMDSNMFGSCQDLSAPFEEIRLEIYPNPTEKEVRINCSQVLDRVEIELSDLNGKVVLNESALSSNTFKLDLGAISSGIYILKVYHQSNILVNEKLVKL